MLFVHFIAFLSDTLRTNRRIIYDRIWNKTAMVNTYEKDPDALGSFPEIN